MSTRKFIHPLSKSFTKNPLHLFYKLRLRLPLLEEFPYPQLPLVDEAINIDREMYIFIYKSKSQVQTIHRKYTLINDA